MKAPYAVMLSQLDDGSIHVHVGCREFSYRSPHELVEDLVAYFSDPQATMKRFSEKFEWKGVHKEIETVVPYPFPGPGQSVPKVAGLRDPYEA